MADCVRRIYWQQVVDDISEPQMFRADRIYTERYIGFLATIQSYNDNSRLANMIIEIACQ